MSVTLKREELQELYKNQKFKEKVIKEANETISHDINMINGLTKTMKSYTYKLIIFLLLYSLIIKYLYYYLLVFVFILLIIFLILPRLYIRIYYNDLCDGLYKRKTLYYYMITSLFIFHLNEDDELDQIHNEINSTDINITPFNDIGIPISNIKNKKDFKVLLIEKQRQLWIYETVKTCLLLKRI
jgi:hypothetical protein